MLTWERRSGRLRILGGGTEGKHLPESTSKLFTQKEALWVCLRITLVGVGYGVCVETLKNKKGHELIVVAAG